MKTAEQRNAAARGFNPTNPRANTNPPCQNCGGPAWKDGFQQGRQRYRCQNFCGARPVRKVSNNPYCITCHAPMRKLADRKGAQQYACHRCRNYAESGPYRPVRRRRRRAHVAPILTPEARQAQRAAVLLERINRALPYALPNREDVAQEMAVGALTGEFKTSDIARMVPIYRRKVNRQSSDPFRFISLSQPIADGLTFGDTLAG